MRIHVIFLCLFLVAIVCACFLGWYSQSNTMYATSLEDVAAALKTCGDNVTLRWTRSSERPCLLRRSYLDMTSFDAIPAVTIDDAAEVVVVRSNVRLSDVSAAMRLQGSMRSILVPQPDLLEQAAGAAVARWKPAGDVSAVGWVAASTSTLARVNKVPAEAGVVVWVEFHTHAGPGL